MIATNGIIHAIDTVMMPPTDIVQAADVLNFNTLTTAINNANAVLNGSGPFTLFAPTDAAFKKLPNGTVDRLLKSTNKTELISLLQYHVIKGRVTAANITAMSLPAQFKMLSGVGAIVEKDGDKIQINKATVVASDVIATNGIIHAIDTVMMPPTDIVQAADVLNFNTLTTAINNAMLDAVLNGSGPFTLFAPTDAAFKKLPNGTVDRLLKSTNKTELISLLQYHVIKGRVTAANITAMSLPAQFKMLSGVGAIVEKDGDKIQINKATVVASDVIATNGIIHAIDTVLMPPKSAANSFDLKQGYNAMLLGVMVLSYSFLA